MATGRERRWCSVSPVPAHAERLRSGAAGRAGTATCTARWLRAGTARAVETRDALRRPDRFRELLIACEADYAARASRPGPTRRRRTEQALDTALAVTLTADDLAGRSGEQIGALLRERRLAQSQRYRGGTEQPASASDPVMPPYD